MTVYTPSFKNSLRDELIKNIPVNLTIFDNQRFELLKPKKYH